MKTSTPVPAGDDLILKLHAAHYLDQLKWVTSAHQEIVLLNPDTYFGPTSLDIARLAVGGVTQAVDEVVSGRAMNALAVARPPGHHAVSDNAMGFCIFGNVALAARSARETHGLERIMIVDYDVHHGNGTQALLYNDPHTLFVSTHQYPFYPGTGSMRETGSQAGQGYTINIPLSAGHGDANYLAIFREIIWPLADRYKPQLLVVSAGFDAHWDDPLAHMNLSLTGYAYLTRELMRMADKHCNGKIVFVLEGGYHLRALAHGVRNIAHALLGDDDISDPLGPSPQQREPATAALIAEIKRIHQLD
jgi:acetoin utilization deacetylase AcuC-like enzyme